MQDRMAEFEALCRRSGLKVTPQRTEIFGALISTTEHPSAETLWQTVRQKFPNISLDTVNRTLLTLNKIGAAFVVEGSGDVKRYDGGSKNHQHLRCLRCRKIVDFHHTPFDDIEVPADKTGDFKVLRKTVYIEGVCIACQNEIGAANLDIKNSK
jgi:Fur family peroxide stress response transcriptional regulator